MKNYKSVDFDSWGGIDAFLNATSGGNSLGRRASYLKSVVPWLYKANLMVSNFAAGMPFEVVNSSGDVIDTSTDWGNVTGGIDNPRKLISLLAGSLCGGSAYLIPEITSRAIVDLRYISPYTISPVIDSSGVKGFIRTLSDGTQEHYTPEELIYFWLPDCDVELGPPLSCPMSAALLAAEMLASMSTTMKTYSDRGFVPAYLGSVEDMPSDQEKKRAEGYLTQFLKGAYHSVVKLINANALTLQKVGAGMEEMKSAYTEIQQAAIEDIGTAFGIPAALFMSDKAFASEVDSLLKTMYESSVFVSIYQTIEETLNTQILSAWDYRLQFRPESLHVFQEDESQRAGAVGSYVDAINTDPETARFVMSFMGVDLDEEQEAELDALVESKNKKPENPAPVPPEQAVNNTSDNLVLTPDETKDLTLWYSKAKAWFLKGKGSAVDWECKHLRDEIAAPIRVKLANAKNELDIVKAFELNGDSGSDIQALADAINRAVDETK